MTSPPGLCVILICFASATIDTGSVRNSGTDHLYFLVEKTTDFALRVGMMSDQLCITDDFNK